MADLSNRLRQFDRVYAEFRPKRTDDLRAGVRDMTGMRCWWEAMYIQEEGEMYAGQLVLSPLPFSKPMPFAWVPEEDLMLLVVVRGRGDYEKTGDLPIIELSE